MDPLSITTGVFSLLAVCVRTGMILKDFYDSAAIADTKVKGLLTEVESFTQVLRLMKETLEQENIQTSFQATGHIGNHLNNLATSVRDGQETLLQLQETVERVNKSVSLLDGARKHLRLRSAADEIAVYQQQIRSYRDTLQLTLQTVVLWNQVTFRESTDKILPNLDDMQREIRRIAHDINNQIAGLQNVIESRSIDHELHVLRNLNDCVKSAASIVSSASTTLSVNQSDRMSVGYESDFGDCFPSEPGEAMLRWISSNTVYEFEEEIGTTSSLSGPKVAPGKTLELVEEGSGSDQSDSDGELEAEIIQSLLRRGKDKLASQEFEDAERHLRNCLTRASSKGPTVSLHRLGSKSEIMTLLLVTYRHQEKWDEAHSLLTEKIALESRGSSKTNQGVLADTLVLVEVLLKKCAYAEALLYGRRALKSYRKLGPEGMLGVQNSLRLLCQVCKAAGNHDEEDAYGAILSDVLQRPLPAGNPTTSTISEQHDHESKASSKISLEGALPMEGPSVQSVNTPDTLKSNSSWVPSSQSTSTPISAKSYRRYSSLSSLGSSGPASPHTAYSSSSIKSQERMLNIKDPSLSHPKDTTTSQLQLSTLEDTFKQQEADGNQVPPINELMKFVPLMAESDQLSGIQQPKDDVATASIVTLATSSLSSSPLKLELLERESELLKEQNDSQTFHNQNPTAPIILLPVSDQTKDLKHPKLPVALEPMPSRSANTVPKPHPGFNFSHLMANHALNHLEVDAIEYFRAKKGNPPKPPKPVDPEPREPVPVSDYELLQWTGTHPDFPFDNQSDMVEVPVSSLEIPQKTFSKSKSAIDLFNLGILELPTELPPRSRSTVNLPNSNSTNDIKSKPPEAIPVVNGRNGLDTIFADLGGDIFTGTPESTTASESGTTPTTVPPQQKEQGVLIDILKDEDDDRSLKKLTEMGYPRIRAVSALERYNYDLERAINYLASGTSEEPRSPRIETDIWSKRTGVVDPFRFYAPSVFETAGNSSTSASNLSSSFKSPPNPVSFHDLVQLQNSTLSAGSHFNRLGPTALTSHRSESNLTAQAKLHKKNRSFDSGFPDNHKLNPTIEERRPTTAKSRQDEVLENDRRLDINRPRNPIAARWDADSYTAVELPTDGPCIANDLAMNFPRTLSSYNKETGKAGGWSSYEQKLQAASPGGSSTRPAVTFSEMLNNQAAIRRKVVVSGDVFCGKSSLVSVFSKGVFPEMYHSTELEIGVVQETSGDKSIELRLWDTGGDVNHTAFRLQCYPDSHLVMICFAIDSPDSLDNAEELFITELKKAHISAPYMLVGLKKDLRHNPDTINKLRGTNQHPVTLEEGQAVSIRIRALRYMECSAKIGEGVKEVFEAAARFTMLPNEKLKKTRSFRRLFGKDQL